MTSSSETHCAELLSWIGAVPAGVAGTMTFRPYLELPFGKREYLTTQVAQSCVRHFLQRLDRLAFGSAGARQGKKVRAISVREGWDDWSSKHLHYHMMLEVPCRFSPEDWADAACRSWARLRWASPDQNRFSPTWSSQWLPYIMKTRDKPVYLDAMDFENWRLV